MIKRTYAVHTEVYDEIDIRKFTKHSFTISIKSWSKKNANVLFDAAIAHSKEFSAIKNGDVIVISLSRIS